MRAPLAVPTMRLRSTCRYCGGGLVLGLHPRYMALGAIVGGVGGLAVTLTLIGLSVVFGSRI